VATIQTPSPRAHAAGPRVTRVWRTVLGLGFILVCMRFQVAAFRSAGPDVGPLVVLAAGSLALGVWNPLAALFAFTLAAPLLNGLGQDNLVNGPSLLSLSFSALWLGVVAKAHFRGRAQAEEGSAPRLLPVLIAEILIAAVLLSLAWELWGNRHSPVIREALLDRPVLGFGDPCYFLTSAFVWLQGLYYFRELYGRWHANDAGAGEGEASAAAWVKPFFLSYGTAMAVFVLIQLVLHIPEGWTSAGIQGPFEDISSFGSIALVVLVFAVATCRRAGPWRLAFDTLACAALLGMLVASWSRAAWLAGLVFLPLASAFRLPRKWTVAFVLAAAAALALIDVGQKSDLWNSQPYLARLSALARLESPAQKDPARMNLYRKAAAMIRAQPITGHGIGSFHQASVNYAQPGDPNGSVPEFAHNAFLQVASELGVPVAALLAALVAWGLWRGIRSWVRRGPAEDALLVLGMTLSLGAYLQTQMTSNSLNVYVSNQFVFWFLLAAILAMSRPQASRGQ
jgi:O-antigen ligase